MNRWMAVGSGLGMMVMALSTFVSARLGRLFDAQKMILPWATQALAMLWPAALSALVIVTLVAAARRMRGAHRRVGRRLMVAAFALAMGTAVFSVVGVVAGLLAALGPYAMR